MPFRHSSYHRCPRCEEVALNESRSFGVHRYSCRSCFGAWLGWAELQRQFQAHAVSDEGRVFRTVSGGTLTCPHAECRYKMRTLVVGEGIEIDFCTVHGFWFDCGELSKALAGAGQVPRAVAEDELLVVQGTLKRLGSIDVATTERLGQGANIEVCVVCFDGAARCAMCADHICTKHLVEYTCDTCRRQLVEFGPG